MYCVLRSGISYEEMMAAKERHSDIEDLLWGVDQAGGYWFSWREQTVSLKTSIFLAYHENDHKRNANSSWEWTVCFPGLYAKSNITPRCSITFLLQMLSQWQLNQISFNCIYIWIDTDWVAWLLYLLLPHRLGLKTTEWCRGNWDPDAP